MGLPAIDREVHRMGRKTLMLALAGAGLVSAGNVAYGWNLNPADWFGPRAVRASATEAAFAEERVDEGRSAEIAPTAAPDYRAIFQRFGPAVVGVTVDVPAAGRADAGRADSSPTARSRSTQSATRSQGSGFIIQRDGLILTNAHIVRDARAITIRLADRRELPAQVLGADATTDVAVLRIQAKDLPTVIFGDPAQIAIGDYVLAIGLPSGFDQSATSGIISAKSRTLPGDTYVPFIQTDVATRPGNSGGPLFNARGRVIGINSQVHARGSSYEGLSFAVPIDVALRVKNQIVSTGSARHARLGAAVQDVDQALAESFKLDAAAGALVSAVAPGSAAERSGLRSGDVIVAFNSRRVERAADLATFVGAANPGDKAALEVVRQGKRRPIDVLLSGPQEPPLAVAEAERTDAWLGVSVRPLDANQSKAARVRGGLIVEQVSGAAARAGIEPGDVIIAVNGRPIVNLEQWRTLLGGQPRQLALLVQRGDLRIFVPVKLN
ncbi:MAG: trypsin-like peptidase domain-containing protein [Burkholderiaceae bacterium]